LSITIPPQPGVQGDSTRRNPRSRRLWALVATATLIAVGIAVPVTAAQAAPTLLSQGKSTTASSTESSDYLPPSAATDGKTGTRWGSQRTDNEWLQVDLGQTSTISRVEVNWETAYGSAYQIQVSATGTGDWTNIYSTTTGKGGIESLTVSGSGRYVRMQGVKRATGYGYSLWEFQVFGTAGTPTPDPTVSTTVSTAPTTSYPADGKVRIVGSPGSWQLVVNGVPWTVKGMTWGPAITTFPAHVANLKAMGVNTIRTWGTDAGSKALFDAAATAGIRVVAGFWLAPGGGPGSGGCPNYLTDATYKSNSMNDIVTWVTAYKDNPGVLMWDVGNESLLGLQNCYSGADLEAQRNAYAAFVNDAAKKIHSIDPSHPVTSTDAWTGSWVYYKANSPDLDLYGLNSYGAVCDAKQTWISGGYTKPYLITEGGPQGSWEAPADINGIPNQGTDQDNANGYTNAWNCIQAHPGVALGATFFHYGTEGDFGGIWFNVIPGGNKRLSYYAIARAYGGPAGNPGTNTPPTFQSVSINGSTSITAGSTVTMNAAVSDPNGDAITYHVFLNSNPINNAGGLQEVPYTSNGTSYVFTAPQTLGVWKAYLFAEDGRSNVGVQTVSFRVVPPAVGGTNLALGRPASASSFDPYNGNFTPGQATDGNYSTRWSSSWADGEWIQVDLGAKKTFHNVQLAWESAYGKGYTIAQSDDGATWSPLATVTNGDGNVDTIAVNGNARFVRMQGVTRGTGYGYSLYEFGVYS